MNIAIDIDDVLADFQIPFLKFYNNQHGTSFTPKDITTYSYADVLGIPFDEVLRTVYAFYDTKEFIDITPTQGSQAVVHELSKKHRIFVLTSRPFHIENTTQQWIKKHFENCICSILHTNQFSNNASNITKTELCLQNEIALLLEDAPPYIVDALRHNIKTIVFDKPWNRNIPDHPLLTRVKSWKEVQEIVEGKMVNAKD